jgi:drug/metabolite transporter (DMT)-like permease
VILLSLSRRDIPFTIVASDTLKRAYLAWIVVCIVWGTTYLAIRIALDTIPPFLMASMRWLAAGGVLLAALVARGEQLPDARKWMGLAVIGFLTMGIGNGGVVWAEQTVPSGLTAVLVGVAPFWMVGIDRLLNGGDRLGGRRLFGLLLGFAGIVLLVWPELRLGGGGRGFLAGVAATQVANFGWAIGSGLLRRRPPDESVLAATGLQMVFAGTALLTAGTVLGEWSSASYSGRALAAVAYLVIAGSVVGYSAYAYALRYLPISTISLYAYINPVIAVILGTIFLAEPFDLRILAAAALILAGSAIVKYS